MVDYDRLHESEQKPRTWWLWALVVTLGLLVLFAAMCSDAAPRRKCPPKCQHRKPHACAPVRDTVWLATAPAPAPSIGSQILGGFYLGAGFRWDREHGCPTLTAGPCPRIEPPGRPRVVDPFYLAAGVRVPLASWVDWDSKFARDFTEAPEFQVTTELQFAPWRKR